MKFFPFFSVCAFFISEMQKYVLFRVRIEKMCGIRRVRVLSRVKKFGVLESAFRLSGGSDQTVLKRQFGHLVQKVKKTVSDNTPLPSHHQTVLSSIRSSGFNKKGMEIKSLLCFQNSIILEIFTNNYKKQRVL